MHKSRAEALAMTVILVGMVAVIVFFAWTGVNYLLEAVANVFPG